MVPKFSRKSSARSTDTDAIRNARIVAARAAVATTKIAIAMIPFPNTIPIMSDDL
jgi:hypothetical protein